MSLETDIKILSRCPILSQMPYEALRLLAFGSDHVVFPQDTYLFRQSDAMRSSFVLISGRISISMPRTESYIVEEAGTLIGERALVTKSPSSYFEAITLARTELVKVKHETFWRILNEFPQAAQGVHDHLVERLKSFTSDLRNTTRD